MTRRPIHFHLGLDQAGDRLLRLRSAAELRRYRERQRLRPKLVLALACAAGQPVWRNGMHRRRYLCLSDQARGDRCCFLMTLRRSPLVRPVRPF